MNTTATSLPRDCIYSILPFLTLNELACTSVRISRQWYSAAQTLHSSRSLDLHRVGEPELILKAGSQHRLLFVSSLRHHVQHLDSIKWQIECEQTKSDEDEDSNEFHIQMAEEANQHHQQKVQSIVHPLEQTASHLPQLVSLRFEASIESFDQRETSFSMCVFPKSLHSLSLTLDFDYPAFDRSVWNYVERLFELVAQQLAHSLIVFRCDISGQLLSDDEDEDEDEEVEMRDFIVYNPKILRHLTSMRELRLLDLHSQYNRLHRPDAIECLRSIPQLNEISLSHQEQIPELLCEPLQQKYTRISHGFFSDLFDYPRIAEHDRTWVCAILGRTFTHLNIHFNSLIVAIEILPHFTQLIHLTIAFFCLHHSQVPDQLVSAFVSSGTHLEQLTLIIDVERFNGLSGAIKRILESTPRLTQLSIQSLAIIDFNFLIDIPQITRQLNLLSLNCHRVQFDSYCTALTHTSFPSLTTLELVTPHDYFVLLDSMFRPTHQLTPSYSYSYLSNEVTTVVVHSGFRVPILPSLRHFSLVTTLRNQRQPDSNHDHAMRIIHQVEKERCPAANKKE